MEMWTVANLSPWIVVLAAWIPLAGWVLAMLDDDEAEG